MKLKTENLSKDRVCFEIFMIEISRADCIKILKIQRKSHNHKAQPDQGTE